MDDKSEQRILAHFTLSGEEFSLCRFSGEDVVILLR